jgi:hypothetical protein
MRVQGSFSDPATLLVGGLVYSQPVSCAYEVRTSRVADFSRGAGPVMNDRPHRRLVKTTATADIEDLDQFDDDFASASDAAPPRRVVAESTNIDAAQMTECARTTLHRPRRRRTIVDDGSDDEQNESVAAMDVSPVEAFSAVAQEAPMDSVLCVHQSDSLTVDMTVSSAKMLRQIDWRQHIAVAGSTAEDRGVRLVPLLGAPHLADSAF